MNKTTLNAKKVLIANLLKNKFITILYVILAFIFLGISIYETASDALELKSQIAVHIAFFLISMIFAFAIPLYRTYTWKKEAKRNYGSTTVDVDYQFTDINFRMYHNDKVIEKYDYHNIYNVIKRKNLMIIVGSSKLFVVDIDGFKNEAQLARVEEYIKRFTK